MVRFRPKWTLVEPGRVHCRSELIPTLVRTNLQNGAERPPQKINTGPSRISRLYNIHPAPRGNSFCSSPLLTPHLRSNLSWESPIPISNSNSFFLSISLPLPLRQSHPSVDISTYLTCSVNDTLDSRATRHGLDRSEIAGYTCSINPVTRARSSSPSGAHHVVVQRESPIRTRLCLLQLGWRARQL